MSDFYFRILEFHIRRAEAFHLAHFFFVIHRVQHESAFVRAQKHGVLAVVHGEFGDPDILAFFQRLGEQRIRTTAGFLRHHVIRGVKVNRVNFRRFHELEDLHVLRGLGLDLLDLLGLDDDVFVFAILIALDDLAALENFVIERTNELLLDTVQVVAMQLVERNTRTPCSGKQAHGN